MSHSPTLLPGSSGPPPAPGARATAWTITGFLAVTVALSVTPGVPDDLRPLKLATDDQRTAVVARVFARPKMTLAEHERKLEGHVDDAVAESADNAAAEEQDLHDESRAATDLVALTASVPAPPAAEAEEAAPAIDRVAVVARVRGKRGELQQLRAQHTALHMPGSAIINPCVVKEADSEGCEKSALEPFFATLDAIARGDADARANVVVLGNSLIASDHVTDVVRARLTEAFGDAGRGFLLPERLVKGVGRRVRTGEGSDGWLRHSFAQDPPFAEHVRFGFSGAVYEASVDGERSVFRADGANSARLFWLDTGAPLTLEVDGKAWLQVPAAAAGVVATQEARDVDVRLPPLAKQVKLVAGKGARVFGVALERDHRGVMVDTIGVPAASTKLYTESVDQALFVGQLKARAPTLNVVMLGGNETRALSWGTLDEATFGARLSALLDNLAAAAPEASCLVVTPIDAGKTTAADDTLVTREEINRVIAVQKQVAAAKGCALFDLFEAMGGAGSLQRMREVQLVSDDLVHPTARGGDVLGQLFADAVLSAWAGATPQGERYAHRRPRQDASWPRFAGLSFPKRSSAGPVVLGAEPTTTEPRPLSRFFARLKALERGEEPRVAIGQFGASHTAGQTLTDRMRERLAARYGGAGRGFVAVGGASKRLVPGGVVRDIVGAFDIADGRDMVTGGALGMAGTKTRLLPGSRFTVGFCQGCPPTRRPRAGDDVVAMDPGTIQLAWLYTPDMGTADVWIDGERRATLTPSTRRRESDVQFLTLPVDHERAVLEVVTRSTPQPSSSSSSSSDSLPAEASADSFDGGTGERMSPVGPVHLLGVVEEMDRPGIVLDAVGLPGTTGMTPQRWRQDMYAEEVRSRRYDLIVTAWGTNEAGIGSLDDATYRHHFGATLTTLQSAAPDADCLIIGASDRFDHKAQGFVQAPNHELVERVQKELAAEHGCAFFSMREAMGGAGSMKRWVAEGLGLPDHVHFTKEGYVRLADAIIDDLLAAAVWQSDEARQASGVGEAGAGGAGVAPADTGHSGQDQPMVPALDAVSATRAGTTAQALPRTTMTTMTATTTTAPGSLQAEEEARALP